MQAVHPFESTARWFGEHWRGVGLSMLVGIGGLSLGRLEAWLWGREWIEGLVLAILFGLLIRFWWTPESSFKKGIAFSAKPLLEIAIVLLGASVDATTLRQGGWMLPVAIVGLVAFTLCIGMMVGRLCGLPPRLATLVACGNAICGNSAIAALAPVIKAEEEQVSAAVAFTALGSILVVIALPLLKAPLHLACREFGILTGLSVYAVPQVLAATAGASAVAVQIGTLVKLTRVLMLGPVTLFFSLRRDTANQKETSKISLKWSDALPPFILGFAALALLRSVGLIPGAWAELGRGIASLITLVAMAALGLSSDPRAVARAGRPVLMAATLSLVLLVTTGVLLIKILGL